NVTATDLAGNAANASFVVTLVDAPFITRGPGAAYAFTGSPGSQTLTISAGQVSFIADAASSMPNLSVILSGTASLAVNSTQHLNNLEISPGLTASIAS